VGDSRAPVGGKYLAVTGNLFQWWAMFRSALLFLLLVTPFSVFASLTVSQPVNGTTVSNPVHVVGYDSEAVAVRIYVDGVSKYSSSSKTIDTSIYVSSGQRTFVVQTWDKYGNVEKYAVGITAKTSSLAKSIYNLEENWWGNCGTCGNHIGDTRYVSGGQGIGYSPALKGKSSKFSIGGSNPYTNYYWYLKNGWGQYVSRIKISLDLFVPGGSDPQAIEFESQHRWKNYLYNFSLQLGYKSYRWKTFDYITNVWKDTGVGFSPLSPDKWHHLESEWEIDHTNHRRKLVAFSLDGRRMTPVSAVYLPAKYSTGPDYMTIGAFQLDMNRNAQDFHVYVDNFTFSYQ
jgi:hypothetical protein